MNRLVLCLLALAFLVRAEMPPPASVVVHGPSGEHTFTAAELGKLPRVKVSISDHGTNATFEGTELRNLLAVVGAPAGEALRGKEIMKYVVVEGADGYRALFALPELDSGYADRKVILADVRDGKALPEKESPFRIVVEGEKRQARCVRQVVRITVVAAP